jgi:DNA-directed RNA polymerase subunit RPC12/RpoP
MSGLACWSCGRQIYTVSPLESLTAEERRCPRCGAFLHYERRGDERRTGNRRQDGAGDASAGDASAANATLEDDAERRVDERRHERRRAPSDGTGRSAASGGELSRAG